MIIIMIIIMEVGLCYKPLMFPLVWVENDAKHQMLASKLN